MIGKAPYGGAPFRVGKSFKATGSAGGFFTYKNRGIFLPGLSCKVVYDTTLAEESEFYSVYNFRRRGLKYKNMTKWQRDRLIYLLKKIADKSIESVGEKKA